LQAGHKGHRYERGFPQTQCLYHPVLVNSIRVVFVNGEGKGRRMGKENKTLEEVSEVEQN
jgi:hypothetical protein